VHEFPSERSRAGAPVDEPGGDGGPRRVREGARAVEDLRRLSGREPALPPAAGQMGARDESVSAAAQRFAAIVDAAHRAAAEIRDDAQAEAEAYVQEAGREADRLTLQRIAMMSELTDSLAERFDLLHRHAEEVSRALEEAMRALAATVASTGRPGPDPPSPRTAPPAPPAPAPPPDSAG
jgi:hypothetical protein